MELKYDIQKYIAKVKMSSKIRVLVEGRDDKAHIKNLLDVISVGHKIKLDTAEDIKGSCNVTAKNNKAKIDKIFLHTSDSEDFNNLYFLCDREFYKFEILDKLYDLMVDHESIGKKNLTLGHSIENYFFESAILINAYRYLCGIEYKTLALSLYEKTLPSAFVLIAAITLAAKDVEKSSFPAGTIGWSHFYILDGKVFFNSEKWANDNQSDIALRFLSSFKQYLIIVANSQSSVCAKFARGHTAMLMLQRIFASCLHHVMIEHDEEQGVKDAESFSKIKESMIASALCESWIKNVELGKADYPRNLISVILRPV